MVVCIFLCLQAELARAFFVMLFVSWKNKQQQISGRTDEDM